MGLLIAAGFVLGLFGLFGYLAWTYPVDSRDLVDGSVVGGHPSAAPLW